MPVSVPCRPSRRARHLLPLVVGAGALLLAACPGVTESDDDPRATRFAFTNTGPCSLNFNFTGGVSSGTEGLDHTPAVGSTSDVPVTGEGTVTVTIRSAPAGDNVGCGMAFGFSDGARYVLKDGLNPGGYCGGDQAIFRNPAPGNPTTYVGQVVRASNGRSC